MSQNSDNVATPRLAAAVILVRDAPIGDGFELLLTQRNENSKFMGGFWVFPGGSVDSSDGDGPTGLMAAARREVAEEVGIELTQETELVEYDHWITPEALPKRFDTHFFLAPVAQDTQATVDGSECTDLCWLSPQAALDAVEAGGFMVAFPTMKQLEHLRGFAATAELLEHAASSEIVPIQPRVLGLPDSPRVVMPGEPGFY